MDYNGHIIDSEEIIKTAHEFVMNLSKKYININHEDNTVVSDVVFVESFVAPVDIPTDDTPILA